MRIAIVLIATSALLAGCAGTSTFEVQKINIPIPVACQEPMPVRPVYPTEGLRPPVSLDAFAAAAMAEIERRDGYELELVTALEACRAPIAAKPAGGLGLKR